MTYVDKTTITNSFHSSFQYIETAREKNVEHKEEVFSQKITYEKKLTVISRIATAVLLLLATASIVPCVLYFKQVKGLWQQVITGRDKTNRQVRFGEEDEVRIFEQEKEFDEKIGIP